MKLLLSVMTCDGREASLAETLTSLSASDWGGSPLIVRDTDRLADPRISQTTTAHQLLTQASEREWDYLIFCEDDVSFNRHLRHNLEVWLSSETVRVGTVYCCSCDESEAPAWNIGGSQAIVINRSVLGSILTKWDKWPSGWMQDLRIYRTVKAVPIHQPNLVQHRQIQSTWNGPTHQSRTFAPDYRAERKTCSSEAITPSAPII